MLPFGINELPHFQAEDPLQQPTPGRERVGGGLRDAQIMGTAAVGVAQKEDDEQGIDEQDIFDGVVLFLAAKHAAC